MPRIARIVIPGVPHHITQRGNRRQRTFLTKDDYQAYIDLMVEWCGRCKVEVWAYCLMPNHVHLIAVPATETGLARAIAEAHRRYTRRVNMRENWTGFLWQGRFRSFPMDERHTLLSARYIERNPVLGGLVRRAEDYRWSSARAHVSGKDNAFVKVKPLLRMIGDWQGFLLDDLSDHEVRLVRRHERTGRPLGSEEFVERLERVTGRRLKVRKKG